MLAALLTAFVAQSGPALPPQVRPIDDASRWLRVTPWQAGTASTLRNSWTTYGNGPAHTGYYPDVVPGTWMPSWTTELGPMQQLAIADGRVYATRLTYSEPGWLKAVDESTGALLWTFPSPSIYSTNSPTFDDGHVFIQCGNGSSSQLLRIRADVGLPNWSGTHTVGFERYLAPTVANGRVFLGGGFTGGMYGFRQSDGEQLFFYGGLPLYDLWTPSFYAGTVYTWMPSGLGAHDPETGALRWSIGIDWNWSPSINRTVAMANGRAFAISSDRLYAIDLSTHTVAWSVFGGFDGTPAVSNGVVFAIADDVDEPFDRVKAYDAWNGHFLGSYIGTEFLWNQPIVTDDAVIVGSQIRTYVFDRATFQQRWSILAGGYLSLANRRLCIATAGGGRIRTYRNGASPTSDPNLVAEWEPWTPAVGTAPRSARIAITNYGAQSSPACHVGLYLSGDTALDVGDTLLRLVTIGPIGIGEKLEAGVLIGTSPLLTDQYLLAVPDQGAAVPETNENNVAPSGRIIP